MNFLFCSNVWLAFTRLTFLKFFTATYWLLYRKMYQGVLLQTLNRLFFTGHKSTCRPPDRVCQMAVVKSTKFQLIINLSEQSTVLTFGNFLGGYFEKQHIQSKNCLDYFQVTFFQDLVALNVPPPLGIEPGSSTLQTS